jgi:NADH dehydrogenase
LLTFVVVGGGPTGVELAGALGEITRQTLRGDFRNINPADSEVLLLEGADRILPPYPPELSHKAVRALQRLGVNVHTKTRVTDINDEGVSVVIDGKKSFIPASTVLWGAGVQASPLARLLGEATGAEIDRGGRVRVDGDMTLPGNPDVFVVGDMALALGPNGKPLPGVAPVAMQQGKYVAKVIEARLKGEAVPEPFKYFDKGSMATIGRAAAVAHIGPLKFNGFMAWLAWLFVHLLYIAEFDNRLLILVQWAWNYFTKTRGARLITGSFHHLPSPPKKGQSIAMAESDGRLDETVDRVSPPGSHEPETRVHADAWK